MANGSNSFLNFTLQGLPGVGPAYNAMRTARPFAQTAVNSFTQPGGVFYQNPEFSANPLNPANTATPLTPAGNTSLAANNWIDRNLSTSIDTTPFNFGGASNRVVDRRGRPVQQNGTVYNSPLVESPSTKLSKTLTGATSVASPEIGNAVSQDTISNQDFGLGLNSGDADLDTSTSTVSKKPVNPPPEGPKWFGENGIIAGASQGLEALTGLYQAYQGAKYLDLAEEQFDFSKSVTQRNLQNQAQQINNVYAQNVAEANSLGGHASGLTADEFVARRGVKGAV